jgi:D-tyrosyl-tRNA(Tyr) deacylase
MLAVIQRVKKGLVKIENIVFSQINYGYIILLGIFEDDDESDIVKLVDKVIKLRVMADDQKKMNLSIIDMKGEILVVSQFTLCADLSGGRRPSFIKAKKPNEAEKLYELFIRKLQEKNILVKTGKFGEYMTVEIFNDGPVTIIIDSTML